MKNSSALFYKTALAICLAIALSSCYLTNNRTDSVSSNEDLGFSDNPNDSSHTDPVGGISALEAAPAVEVTSASFVAGSKDIPLASGLSKVSDDGLDFDSASGSIIAATYKSSTDLETVKSFYSKTLPQLGWKNIQNKKSKVGVLKFKRDNEKLEIEFVNYNGDDLVKFFVETVSK